VSIVNRVEGFLGIKDQFNLFTYFDKEARQVIKNKITNDGISDF
jgi:hypothetical protein